GKKKLFDNIKAEHEAFINKSKAQLGSLEKEWKKLTNTASKVTVEMELTNLRFIISNIEQDLAFNQGNLSYSEEDLRDAKENLKVFEIENHDILNSVNIPSISVPAITDEITSLAKNIDFSLSLSDALNEAEKKDSLYLRMYQLFKMICYFISVFAAYKFNLYLEFTKIDPFLLNMITSVIVLFSVDKLLEIGKEKLFSKYLNDTIGYYRQILNNMMEFNN
ncbi:MAG: hypothetical protein K2X69_05250, partial [Silvanigrellaceae bacterium]|nr:hypothetical protein [Silvanigrellaceae bacterium]